MAVTSRSSAPRRHSLATGGLLAAATLLVAWGSGCFVQGGRPSGLSQTSRSATTVARKAAAVTGVVKIIQEAGKASPAPPLGPKIGAIGLNIAMVCKAFNAQSADKAGQMLKATIIAFADRTFEVKVFGPPTDWLLKKAAGTTDIGELGDIVGTITVDQLKEIAQKKVDSGELLYFKDIYRAMQSIKVKADMIGIDVVGWKEWSTSGGLPPKPRTFFDAYGPSDKYMPKPWGQGMKRWQVGKFWKDANFHGYYDGGFYEEGDANIAYIEDGEAGKKA